MALRRNIVGCAAAALLAALAGCSNVSTDVGFLKFMFRGRSGDQLVAMMFDTTDADNRREGIVGISEKPWGLRDPHLKGFSLWLEIDEDPSVRSAAVRALGKAGNPKYLPNIVTALEDKSPAVRWDAAVALRSMYGEQAVEPLRRHAIEDTSVDVRSTCVQALRNYRRPAIVATMVKCLGDEAFLVRYQAHEALVEAVGRDMGTEPSDWSSVEGANLPPLKPLSRPWWDWAGVSTKDKRPTSQPAAAPSSPWWDWFSVSNPAPKQPTSGPSTQPFRPESSGGPQGPWWDWFGVTNRNKPSPATAPAGKS